MIDIAVATAITTLFLLITSPAEIARDEQGYGVALFSIIVWIFIESFLLAAYGTTPGKALLATSVRTPTNHRPSFTQAFARSVRVWFFGLGLGLPLVSLFTMIAGYRRVVDKGIASWDEASGLLVSHGPIDAGRVVAAILAALLAVYLIAVFRAAVVAI